MPLDSYVVLDIETLHEVDFASIRCRGGFRDHLDPAWRDVLPAQVCAVRVDGGAETRHANVVVNWPGAAPLANPHCPHLTQAAVDAGVAPAELFATLHELADGAEAFVGYNVAFDMGCLRHHAFHAECPLPDAPDVCLMAPAAKRMGLRRWPKLVDAYAALVGPPDARRAHDAEYDVHMTRGVYAALFG